MYLPPLIPVNVDALRDMLAPGLPVEDEVQKKMNDESLDWILREVAQGSRDWERRHQVLMYALEGNSQAEIARRLQCDRSTITRDVHTLSVLAQELDEVLEEAHRQFSKKQRIIFFMRRRGNNTEAISHNLPCSHAEVAEELKQIRKMGSFQIPVDSFSEPLAVIGWRAQP